MRKYVYWDAEGLTQMLAQITGPVQRGRTDTSSHGDGVEASTTVTGKVGAVGISGELQIGGKRIETSARSTAKSFEIAHGDAVDQLVSALTAQGQLVEVRGAGDVCTLFRESLPTYLFGRLPLRASPSGTGQDLLASILAQGIVDLHVDQSSIAEGTSFWAKVFMSPSLGKFCELNRNLDGTAFVGVTSHLGRWLRGLSASAPRVGVFAHVREAVDSLYVKPLAMWH